MNSQILCPSSTSSRFPNIPQKCYQVFEYQVFKYVGTSVIQTTTSSFPEPTVVSLRQMPQLPGPQSSLTSSRDLVMGMIGHSAVLAVKTMRHEDCCKVKVRPSQTNKWQQSPEPLRLCKCPLSGSLTSVFKGIHSPFASVPVGLSLPCLKRFANLSDFIFLLYMV